MLDSGEIGQRVAQGVGSLIALILSICVHEFGHAAIADKLGDPLPRAQGRVTLNPIAHIDPVGTLLLPAMALMFPGLGRFIIGWGKPVRISLSARSMTRRWSVKTSHLFIAVAGPLMNLAFALVLSGLLLAMTRLGAPAPLVNFVWAAITLNIGLAFFNLIPCPPLDGGAILHGVLPRDMEWISEALEKYGFIILLALFTTGLISRLLYPAMLVSVWWQGVLQQLMSGWAFN